MEALQRSNLCKTNKPLYNFLVCLWILKAGKRITLQFFVAVFQWLFPTKRACVMIHRARESEEGLASLERRDMLVKRLLLNGDYTRRNFQSIDLQRRWDLNFSFSRSGSGIVLSRTLTGCSERIQTEFWRVVIAQDQWKGTITFTRRSWLYINFSPEMCAC